MAEKRGAKSRGSIARAVGHVPEFIAGATMLGITIVLFAGVMWRYVFGDPLGWSDEVARLMFVWLAFVGAAVGVKRRLHASVSILTARISSSAQRAVSIFTLIVMAALALVFVYVGSIETWTNFGQESMPVSGLPTGWLYLAVPVSGTLMIVYMVPQAWALLLRRRLEPPAAHHFDAG